jgi:hypothetical protein
MGQDGYPHKKLNGNLQFFAQVPCCASKLHIFDGCPLPAVGCNFNAEQLSHDLNDR